jgi:hypothetical protein
MSSQASQQNLSVRRLPLYSLYLAGFVSIAIVYTLAFSSVQWLVALLLIFAWLPFFLYRTVQLYRLYGWVALCFVLVATQGAHFLEHVYQMIQIHVIGTPVAQANGVFSPLNVEGAHLAWNSWVLALTVLLAFIYRRNPWLKVMLVIAIWHTIEHIYIVYDTIRSGHIGVPGLLAQGGAIFGGLPIIRPDLHFLYNLVEEVLLVIIYFYQIRQIRTVQPNEASPVLQIAE